MITHSIEINCRSEDAFAYLEQLERHRKWQREIVKHSFRGVTGAVRPVGTVTIEPIRDGSATRVSIEFNLLGRGIGRATARVPARRHATRSSTANSN